MPVARNPPAKMPTVMRFVTNGRGLVLAERLRSESVAGYCQAGPESLRPPAEASLRTSIPHPVPTAATTSEKAASSRIDA